MTHTLNSWSDGKGFCLQCGDPGSIPGRKMPWEGNGNPPSILAWKTRGWRSLVGYCPVGRKELGDWLSYFGSLRIPLQTFSFTTKLFSFSQWDHMWSRKPVFHQQFIWRHFPQFTQFWLFFKKGCILFLPMATAELTEREVLLLSDEQIKLWQVYDLRSHSKRQGQAVTQAYLIPKPVFSNTGSHRTPVLNVSVKLDYNLFQDSGSASLSLQCPALALAYNQS